MKIDMDMKGLCMVIILLVYVESNVDIEIYRMYNKATNLYNYHYQQHTLLTTFPNHQLRD